MINTEHNIGKQYIEELLKKDESQISPNQRELYYFCSQPNDYEPIFNKIMMCLLVLVVLMALGSCSHGDTSKVNHLAKADGQKIAEAYANGDWKTIVSICDTLMDDEDTMNLVIPYAEALAAVGNPQKGLYLLDKKLSSNPTDYYLYQTKGNVYYSMGKFDSAIISYEKVISMRPSFARAYMNVGETYELIENKDKAIANFLAAAQLFVDNDYIKEASVYAEKVLRLDSANREAKELQRQILSIK